jgi:hypothetical protein
MKLVSLSLLVTGVLGAVSQYCAGFEDSKKPRQLTVKVGSDSSILMYHIADISSSNIPMIIDDQVLRLEPNGFGICTESKASLGRCDAVGTFMVKFDDLHHHLVNKFAYAGEKVNLTISKEGLYCVVTYQEGAELSNVKVVEKHSYGYLPLPRYEKMKVSYLLGALLILTLCAMKYILKDKRPECISSINGYIVVLLLVEMAQVEWKVLTLMRQNRSETDAVLNFVDISSGVDVFYIAGTLGMYYELSVGSSFFKKQNCEKMTLPPLLKRWLLFMGCVGLLAVFQPILKRLFPLQLFVSIRLLYQICFSIAWISTVCILWRNSKITHRKTLDPVFAKKYQRSRLCLIFIPIAIHLVSFENVMVVMNAISNEYYYYHLGDFGKNMKGNFTFVLEFSLNQNYLFVLLKHLPEFSMLLVHWSFLYIWRPSLLDKTEFENNDDRRLADGIDEIKL